MKRLLSLVCLPLVALAFYGCSSSSSSSPPPEQPQTLNFEISSVLVDIQPVTLNGPPPGFSFTEPFYIAMGGVGEARLEDIYLSGTFTDTQQGPAFSLTSALMDVYPSFSIGEELLNQPFWWSNVDLDPIEWIGFDNPTTGAYDVHPLELEPLPLEANGIFFTRTLIGPTEVEVIKGFGIEPVSDTWSWETFESFMDVADAEGSTLEDVQASLANGTRAFLFELGSLINDAIDIIDGNEEALAAGEVLVIPCDPFPKIAPTSVEPSIVLESQIVVSRVDKADDIFYYAFEFTCFMDESSPDDTILGMALVGTLNIHEYFAADAPYERRAVAEWTSLPLNEVAAQGMSGFEFVEFEDFGEGVEATAIFVNGPFNFAVFEEGPR